MILITGLTRSGTSLLFYLFVLSKLHTGYEAEDRLKELLRQLTAPSTALRGGGEYFREFKTACSENIYPDVIKDPYMPNEKGPKHRLDSRGLTPDVVVMTVRNVESILSSELDSGLRHSKSFKSLKEGSPEWEGARANQEARKRINIPQRITDLIQTYPDAIKVEFPRFVSDFDYLWDRVGCLFPDDDKEDLREKFSSVADPELVRF